MNMLIDLIPTTVSVGDFELAINSNFRTSILFELLMQDPEVPDDKKAEEALILYFPKKSLNIIRSEKLHKEAIEAIMYFYACGRKKRKKETDAESEDPGAKAMPIYSYEHDDQYIYSAFLSQYHIDLQEVDYLHWWKFRALFSAMDENCLMSKIMGYRAMKIPQDMPESQKKFYRKMKVEYALPDLRTEEEKEQAFSESLLF